MAVVCSGAGVGLLRSSGIPNMAANYTAAGWFRQNGTPILPDYLTWFALLDSAGTYVDFICVGREDAPGTGYKLVVSPSNITLQTPLADGEWAYLSYVRIGTLHEFRINGVLIGTITKDVSAYPITEVWLGTDSFSTSDN